jgi:hypothetical protein
MSTWKRWPWRYRLGALFALMLLLQGASCPQIAKILPTYAVPGVGDVVPEKFYDRDLDRYYYTVRVKYADDPPRYYDQHHHQGSPEYQAIDSFFKAHPEFYVVDRDVIPGGAARHPPPPVQ